MHTYKQRTDKVTWSGCFAQKKKESSTYYSFKKEYSFIPRGVETGVICCAIPPTFSALNSFAHRMILLSFPVILNIVSHIIKNKFEVECAALNLLDIAAREKAPHLSRNPVHTPVHSWNL